MRRCGVSGVKFCHSSSKHILMCSRLWAHCCCSCVGVMEREGLVVYNNHLWCQNAALPSIEHLTEMLIVLFAVVIVRFTKPQHEGGYDWAAPQHQPAADGLPRWLFHRCWWFQPGKPQMCFTKIPSVCKICFWVIQLRVYYYRDDHIHKCRQHALCSMHCVVCTMMVRLQVSMLTDVLQRWLYRQVQVLVPRWHPVCLLTFFISSLVHSLFCNGSPEMRWCAQLR